MKKFFFIFFTFFNLTSISEIIKFFLQEKEIEKEKKINTITRSSITDRIQKFTQNINYHLLNEDQFSSKKHIKKINKILFNIKDSEQQEIILMEIQSLRRAIHLYKVQQKKEEILDLNDVNSLFLAYNIIPQLEPLIHNYLFSFLLDQESLVNAFLCNKKKDKFKKNIEKIQFIFKNNAFFPIFMDLICTQVNSCGSHMFLQKEGNTIKIHDLFEQSIDSNIEFFTSEITKKYKDLYKKDINIFEKGSGFEKKRQEYFKIIYQDIIKKLNIESKYPVLYDQDTITEPELFNHILQKIILNFSEQYMEEISFDSHLLEVLMIIDSQKNNQYYDIQHIKMPKTRSPNAVNIPFFHNNIAKGISKLDKDLNEIKEKTTQSKIMQAKKKEESKFSKMDCCLTGATILLMAYLYIKNKDTN